MSDFIRRPTPAKDSDFDPTGSTLISTNAEDAIKELANTVGVSASPGYGFGRSGNVVSGTWFVTVGSVPSNKAGITIALNNPMIMQVFVANEDINTFNIEIYQHQGNEINLTLLGTVNVVAARSANFDVAFPATSGYQLAVKLVGGSAKNCNVGLQLKGSV